MRCEAVVRGRRVSRQLHPEVTPGPLRARRHARRARGGPLRGREGRRTWCARRSAARSAWTRWRSRSAERLVETLGGMKGAAMKMGQLASFIDTDYLPDEYRELYQEKLAGLRTSAPAMPWEKVRKVLDRGVRRALRGAVRADRAGGVRRGVDRPGAPRPCCPTAARSRSRSSTRASTPRSAPTSRTPA